MKFVVPKYAEQINGKWWTPQMVRHYRGYSQTTFDRLRSKYTLKQILFGTSIQGEVGKRKFIDRSKVINIGGRSFSIAMIYYYMISRKYIDAKEKSYKQFVALCRSYKQKYMHKDILDSIDLVCMNIGCNIIASLQNLTSSQYDHMKQTYIDYITKSKKDSYDWDSQFDPNDRYMECLAKDRQLYWLYCETVVNDYESVKKELEKYKADNEKLALQVISLRKEIGELQKELFNVRIRKNEWQNTAEKKENF